MKMVVGMQTDKSNTAKKEICTFTVRFDSNIQNKIRFLQGHIGLNKSSIIRLAICELYNEEIAKSKIIK